MDEDLRGCGIVIAFMGDSITEGQYVPPATRWTDLLAEELTGAYADTAVNFLFANRGISGETTRQGLERFPRDIQALRPQIMTLQYGLNDCNCWFTDRGLPRVSQAAFRANLVEMIERAVRFEARHIILSTNHPTLRHKMLLGGDSLEERRLRYNDVVREVARETGVTLCDIEAGFTAHGEAPLDELLLPDPDRLHLSAVGHRLYASLVKPSLSSAVRDCIEFWSERRAKGAVLYG